MRRKNKLSSVVSFRTLADGYCKSIENGKRLIDDGIVLLKNERYLGAINSFRLATEEIIKAHLLNQPVSYSEGDSEKWDWLWSAFRNHSEKQKVILWEFHRDNSRVCAEFNNVVKMMLSTRNDSIYVKFDPKVKRFLSPEESLKFAGELQTVAELERKYAMAIFELFTISGMPTADIIEKVFIMQHDAETNKRS